MMMKLLLLSLKIQGHSSLAKNPEQPTEPCQQCIWHRKNLFASLHKPLTPYLPITCGGLYAASSNKYQLINKDAKTSEAIHYEL